MLTPANVFPAVYYIRRSKLKECGIALMLYVRAAARRGLGLSWIAIEKMIITHIRSMKWNGWPRGKNITNKTRYDAKYLLEQ